MNKTIWQKLTPHLIAIAIFFAISCIYCLPLFKGLRLNGHDSAGWLEMSHQSTEYKAKHGHYPLWTNSMLSGMPTFQIAVDSQYNITLAKLNYVFTLFLPQPANYFFMCCIGFYLLAMAFRVRSWAGVLGGIGYAFASYSAVIASVGHMSKFASMGYMPAMLAGLVLLSQRKYILGFITTLVFGTCLLYQNHLQVVYYTFLVAGLMFFAYLVQCIREKTFKDLLLAAGVAIVAIGLSAGSYAILLLPNQEYAKASIRGGGSELTPADKADVSKGGLGKEYAFHWSYGINETFTMIVPRIYGGSGPSVVNNQYVSEISNGSKTAEVLAERTGMSSEQADDFVKQFSPYWGPQPGTSGTVYMGAIICFLFFAGLVYYRQWHLGWIVAATIVGIVLAWGKNLAGLNFFLFDHLPLYNKFRAPTQSLIIPQLTLPLLAVLALNEIVSDKYDKAELWKKFKTTLAITGAVMVVLIAMYFTLSYTGENDSAIRENLAQGMAQQMSQGKQPSPEVQQQANDFGRSIVKALQQDRQSLYGGDLVRTIVLILLAAGLLWYYIKKTIPSQAVLIVLTALIAFDMLGVDLRYLNNDHYEVVEEAQQFAPTAADTQIKQDTGYYRVLDQTGGNPFLNSRASYFHNNVGGQHPARLQLYDDLMQRQLNKGNMQVYNMLNAKYFIVANQQAGTPVAQQNPEALGAAWLVKTIKYVDNADAEMNALDSFNPKDTVIIDKREQSKVSFQPQFDSAASIRLVQNLNDQIYYEFNAASNQFVVFSEIYYAAGWKAFIDGKETPIVRVNYALRGLPVNAGKHNIEFRFEPRAYYLGDLVSLIAGIISILATVAGLWYLWKKKGVTV